MPRKWKCAPTTIWQKARELSGGNQQKVVLAKWLSTNPRILILDEPTRGIDVGTKAAVHALMSELAAEGMAILMISSELPEVLGMSDRVLVMREGHVTGRFDPQRGDPGKNHVGRDPGCRRRKCLMNAPETATPLKPLAAQFLLFFVRFREAGISVFILVLIAGDPARALAF